MKFPDAVTVGFVALAGALLSGAAYADIQAFTDKQAWIDAVGDFNTIDFTGFEEGTIITDQYADLGVLFTTGYDEIDFSADRYPNDNWGLSGNFGSTTLAFDSPQFWFGADYAFGLNIWFFKDDELVLVASFDGQGGGNFGGIISDETFDGLLLTGDPVICCPFIDDLYFGVPGPGGLAVFIVAGVCTRRRMRSVK